MVFAVGIIPWLSLRFRLDGLYCGQEKKIIYKGLESAFPSAQERSWYSPCCCLGCSLVEHFYQSSISAAALPCCCLLPAALCQYRRKELFHYQSSYSKSH